MTGGINCHSVVHLFEEPKYCNIRIVNKDQETRRTSSVHDAEEGEADVIRCSPDPGAREDMGSDVCR